MATYAEKKAKGKTELRAVGKETVLYIADNYDPDTGEPLDSAVGQFNLKGIENDIENKKVDIERAKTELANLEELYADMQKVIAEAFPVPKEAKQK